VADEAGNHLPASSGASRSSEGYESGNNNVGASQATESELPAGIIFAEPAARRELAPEDESDFAADAEDDEDSLLAEGWSPAIIFLPDGTATNATLALRDGRGGQVLVQLRGMTGLAKPGEIESYEESDQGFEAPLEAPVKTARDEAGLLR
jgi:hypothetical protein